MCRNLDSAIISSLFLLSSLSVIAQDKSFRMPQGIAIDVKLGMSEADFKDVVDMSFMKVDDTRSWRKVYFHPSSDPLIKTLIYYIANDVADQPLYEVIVSYSDDADANTIARHLFGEPNHTSEDSEVPDEWRIDGTSKTVAKWIWVYKNQIVMVARVPGSEWDEEWDDQ